MYINMIKLYDRSGVAVDTITGFTDLSITEEINALDTIEFMIPLSDRTASKIDVEMRVSINDSAPGEKWYQMFTIKSVDADLESYALKIYGIASVDKLFAQSILSYTFDDMNVLAALTGAVASVPAVWTVKAEDDAETFTDKMNYSEKNKTAYDYVCDIIEKYNVEVKFDAVEHKLHVWHRGNMGEQSAECIFWEELNAIGIGVSIDSSSCANHIIALGKEGSNGTRPSVTVDEITDLGRTDYTLGKKLTAFYTDDDETKTANLRTSALNYLRNVCMPVYSFDVSVADLAMVSDKWAHFDFNLGDSIRLMSKTLQDAIASMPDSIELRVVKIQRYPNSPELTKIEVANTRQTLDSIVAKTVRTVSNNTDTYGKLITVDTGLKLEHKTISAGSSKTFTLPSNFHGLIVVGSHSATQNRSALIAVSSADSTAYYQTLVAGGIITPSRSGLDITLATTQTCHATLIGKIGD